MEAEKEEGSLSPFMCEPCFALSLSLSHCARMSSCILPLGKYWEIGEARRRWVEGNEWAAEKGGGKDAAVKNETAAVLITWEPRLSNLAK